MDTINSDWSISLLVIDNYEGNRNKAIETEHPTFMDVVSALKSLNSGSKSSMAIMGSQDSVLAIGGGNGKYYVQATLADNRVFLLSNASANTDLADLIIGSIRTPLQANMLVDEGTAIAAVEEYFAHGTLARSLNWVEG